MNQNNFCTKCHRIPSQCVCGNTQRKLTDEEMIKMVGVGLDEFRILLKKASEK